MDTFSNSVIETIHLEAEHYFDSVVNGIQTAGEEILLESYIFTQGKLADRLVKELIQASNRGLRIRVIVDGAGIDEAFIHYADHMRSYGIKVRIYHPLPWQLKYWPMSLTPSKGLEKLWYLISSINKRNHRKLIIIDSKHVWVGSFNISDTHLSRQEGGQGWRDTAIELQQLDATPLLDAFNKVWFRWSKYIRLRKLPKTSSPFLVNHLRYLRKANKTNLVNRLRQAKNRIWITNAYFVPDATLLTQLEQANERGVEVRILIPKKSDVAFIPWISAYFYDRLLKSGARIFEYTPSMLHAKTLIIDDWATIGSSNFNRRSLFHDLEVDYVLQTPESLQQLEHSFIEDSKLCTEQQIEQLKQYPLWKKWVGGFLLFALGYWI